MCSPGTTAVERSVDVDHDEGHVGVVHRLSVAGHARVQAHAVAASVGQI